MREWTGSASTAEKAVAAGLIKLGLPRDRVDVKILGEITSSLLSLMGFRRVQVKLTEKPSFRDRPPLRREVRRDERPAPVGRPGRPPSNGHPPSAPQRNGPDSGRPPVRPGYRPPFNKTPERPAAPRPRPDLQPKFEKKDRPHPERAREPLTAEQLLALWKDRLNWGDLSWEFKPHEGAAQTVQLKTERKDRLAGKGGETLEAFDLLFNIVLSLHSPKAPKILFELEGVRKAWEQKIIDEAHSAAAQVRRTGRPWRLDPMEPAQRRLVHQTLANEPDVETVSEGEGPFRKVVVRPRSKTP